jgi:hypothetical protein
VLGIDVGWSPRRATTGLCLLTWDAAEVTWALARARWDEASRDRAASIGALLDGRRELLAVAVDGPLRPGLAYRPGHRCAEALLTRGRFQLARRGSPASTAGGHGPRLHAEACRLAALAVTLADVAPAEHPIAISTRQVVEAFPNFFLGVLCDDDDYPERPRQRRRWTDTLYRLREGATDIPARMQRLLASLLPRRAVAGQWGLRNHEDIAALACALAALCVAAGEFVAVGSEQDGAIVLPPLGHWGRDARGRRWAEAWIGDNVTAMKASGAVLAIAGKEHDRP